MMFIVSVLLLVVGAALLLSDQKDSWRAATFLAILAVWAVLAEVLHAVENLP